LENALKEKQEMMAVLGARILEESRKGIESAESQEVRRRSENSALSSIATAVSDGVGRALNLLLSWRGRKDPKVSVQVNTDFVDSKLAPQEITALMGLWQGSGISWDTLFWNLKRGEIIPEGISEQEEQVRIGNSTFTGALPGEAPPKKGVPPKEGEEEEGEPVPPTRKKKKVPAKKGDTKAKDVPDDEDLS
jgi:hypothetical protein